MNGRRRCLIRGRVQGVAFRYHTSMQAKALGVTGWVRNLPDGSVEALFEGDETSLAAMVNWCRSGPPAAMVESVDSVAGDYTGEFTSFTIIS